MIKRELGQLISKYSKQYPIVSLTGPRQSGKTMLIRSVLSKYNYVNLEDPETRRYAQDDPKGFLKDYSGGLIIDEVQRVPELFSYIQVEVDEKKKNGAYILTGSQNFLLLEQISQSLAGRVAVLNLFPLSLRELSKESGVSGKSLDDFLFQGFYPALYDRKMDTSFYYSNYIQTYIEKDVRQIKNIGNIRDFERFLKLCAGSAGQILNVSSLANNCGINHRTANDWLSVLEAGFIIHLLKPHYKNFNKRVVKMPKIYFYDPGLLCALLGIRNKEELKNSYFRGAIFETMIISEFLKHKYHNNLGGDLFFWRDKTGNEIDLLWDDGKKLVPVEIKAGRTITGDYFKGLNYYNKISGLSRKDSYVVYGGEKKQSRSEGNVLGWKTLANEMPKHFLA